MDWPITTTEICTDQNECADGNNCHNNAICTNTIGSFTCHCNTGFSGNGTICNDIDECELKTDYCETNANCTNTNGSFLCQCNTGFTGNGTTCTDIDECALNTHDCDRNANCTNTNGSLTCQCNTGFTGSGITCTDIDECKWNSHNCDPNASCINLEGSFSCECICGFSGNGSFCSGKLPLFCFLCLSGSLVVMIETYVSYLYAKLFWFLCIVFTFAFCGIIFSHYLMMECWVADCLCLTVRLLLLGCKFLFFNFPIVGLLLLFLWI